MTYGHIIVGAHVTGVCSAGSADFVRGLGADEVRDYAGEGWLKAGDGFDVILDTCGATSFARCRRAPPVSDRLEVP